MTQDITYEKKTPAFAELNQNLEFLKKELSILS